MPNYGRNFEYRVQPKGGQRSGRFLLPAAGDRLPIGVPIGVDTGADWADNSMQLQEVDLVTGATAPVSGLHGIMVYEHISPEGYAEHDPFRTTYSDIDTAPLGKACQMVSGVDVKVVLRNTADSTFLQTQEYEGRTMVAGLGATLTLAVGNYLTPGTGNDTAGYWAETGSAANAWLVITKVDNDRSEVEARFVF